MACGLQPVPEPSIVERSVFTPFTDAQITSLKVALFSPQLSRLMMKWLKVFEVVLVLVMV
ncbi:hypothetical protein [Flavobacterium sp.]|uniref:hypothetical protein n=1 Tax=Flavobacterium sp. TaxID=239 RepID=UPI003752AC87